MNKTEITKAELLGLTESVEKYLGIFFENRKNILLRQLANSPADFNSLLQIQANIKAVLSLEQEILLDKIKATSK